MSNAMSATATISPVDANPEIDAVESMMREIIDVWGGPDLGGMASAYLAIGGKRVRARLALAVGDARGVPRELLVPWAAGVELLHNATLVHDDIQDEDEWRRGAPALWVRYGVGQAITVGDLLLILPMLAVERIDVAPSLRWHLARAAAGRSVGVARGQALEMSMMEQGRLDWSSYLEAVRGKTGELLALPADGALLLAGHPPEEARRVADVFADLGVLYQLQDDLRDFLGSDSEPDTAADCDLSHGRLNAVVVAHLSLFPDSSWLKELIQDPVLRNDSENVRRAVQMLRSSGSVEHVARRIRCFSERVLASDVLQALPAVHAVAVGLVRWIEGRALHAVHE